MARKTSERVNQLIEGFMEKHNDGYSIPEIADFYGLNFCTVYNHLQEIADNHGVSRKSLLQVVKSKHSTGRIVKTTTTEDINSEQLLSTCDELIFEINSLQASIQETLN